MCCFCCCDTSGLCCCGRLVWVRCAWPSATCQSDLLSAANLCTNSTHRLLELYVEKRRKSVRINFVRQFLKRLDTCMYWKEEVIKTSLVRRAKPTKMQKISTQSPFIHLFTKVICLVFSSFASIAHYFNYPRERFPIILSIPGTIGQSFSEMRDE